MEFWNQRTFCLITGASRGIGREIANRFSQKVAVRSVFVLVARSARGLQETKDILESTVADIKVVAVPLDLYVAESSDYEEIIKRALITTGTTGLEDFDHAILVHNAGSLGNVGVRTIEQDNLPALRSYYDFNLISMILLTTEFFKVFNSPHKQRSIIQISSIAALCPFKSLSLYCSVKSARDMYMKSIAGEEPSISIINYAPGPVDTEMYKELTNNTNDPEMAKLFAEGRLNILTTTDTITKLVNILQTKKCTKGEHLDYYDEI